MLKSIVKNFFCCPKCISQIDIDTEGNYFCKNCTSTYNVFNEIIDFRNIEGDQTKDFSINDDISLSKIMSEQYSKFKYFNGLYKLYVKLSSLNINSIHEKNIEIAVKDSLSNDVPLTKNQSNHGYDIVKKIKLYENEFNFEKHNDKVCLENGCGLGLFVEGLSNNYKTLLVVDFSMCYLLLAKKICEEKNILNTFLFCGSVENLPLKENCVDLIHSNNVIEHVFNQGKMIKEVGRVLSEKGLLFLLSPNKNSAYFEPHFKIPFYGFIPFKVRYWLIKKFQKRDCTEVVPLSLNELKKIIQINFKGKFNISFIPSKLKQTSQSGFIRSLILSILKQKLIGRIFSLFLNKIFLGIMPYHVVLAKKSDQKTNK